MTLHQQSTDFAPCVFAVFVLLAAFERTSNQSSSSSNRLLSQRRRLFDARETCCKVPKSVWYPHDSTFRGQRTGFELFLRRFFDLTSQGPHQRMDFSPVQITYRSEIGLLDVIESTPEVALPAAVTSENSRRRSVGTWTGRFLSQTA